jgi:hypothetical protein
MEPVATPTVPSRRGRIDGDGQTIIFGDARVELGGKEFRHVDWPLIRGLLWSRRKDLIGSSVAGTDLTEEPAVTGLFSTRSPRRSRRRKLKMAADL